MPTTLKSSFLEHCEYDPTKKTLSIGMRNGKIYHYRNVPQTVHDGLISADSAGQFFQQNIKDTFTMFDPKDEEKE